MIWETFVLPKPNLVKHKLWISFTSHSIKHSLEQECYPRNTLQKYVNVVTFHIIDSILSKKIKASFPLESDKIFHKTCHKPVK